VVPNSRTPSPPAQLRPLNTPRPLTVQTDAEGRPAAVGERRQRVTAVLDEWRLEEEWWRRPLSRHYFQVLLEDGRCLTLFRDGQTGAWWQQTY
jgi:hypothetical protein